MTMNRTTDITSFTELRQHLRNRLNQVRSTGRPLFVTTNGETDAVVLSAVAYDDLVEKAELAESLAMIDRSMEEVRGGKGRPLKEAVREVAEGLGLNLDK